MEVYKLYPEALCFTDKSKKLPLDYFSEELKESKCYAKLAAATEKYSWRSHGRC